MLTLAQAFRREPCVGVDLSAGMLAEAAKRELYDQLVEAELSAFMSAHPSSFHVIVCCDTLVHCGRRAASTAPFAARTGVENAEYLVAAK